MQQLTIAALLTYYTEVSEQPEIIFGIPVHKRSSGLRNIFGMFSGILPFKSDLHRDLKLADLLKQISASRKEDYAHQDYLIVDLISLPILNPDVNHF